MNKKGIGTSTIVIIAIVVGIIFMVMSLPLAGWAVGGFLNNAFSHWWGWAILLVIFLYVSKQ